MSATLAAAPRIGDRERLGATMVLSLLVLPGFSIITTPPTPSIQQQKRPGSHLYTSAWVWS